MLHIGAKINFRFLSLILVVGVLGVTSCSKEELPEAKSTPSAPSTPSTPSTPRDKCDEAYGPEQEMTLAAQREFKDCKVVLALDFMQIQVYDEFECQPHFKRWDLERLKIASSYIREYLEYSIYTKLENIILSDRPSFDKDAREQLVRVLNTIMQKAQFEYEVDDNTAIKLENMLRRTSHDFSKSSQMLLFILEKYKQFGFDSSRQKIKQCVSAYAENRLTDIKTLSKRSSLYAPDYIGDISEDLNAPFYNLGSAARTKAYLEQQFLRARVLADYATPFVEFLNNTDFLNNPISKYWKSTLAQLSMKQEFADPNSQAAIIDDFIINNLSIMTPNNCRDLIMKQEKYVLGMGLFSEKQNLLQQQSKFHCEKKNNIGQTTK